ncbi:MAG: hypothetical protein J6V56_00800 [Clostridia bacterium]|nr:hypothetical protein [Clostridia bacterium]
MKYQITNKKLNIVLDELADEYKNLLIEAALNQKNEIQLENINISDITKIDIDIKERLKNRTRNHKINRISDSTTLLGMLYSLFGLVLISIASTEDTLIDSQLYPIAIICVFFGFIIAIVGMMIRLFMNSKNSKNKNRIIMDYEFQIISTWRTIEGLVYQVSPQNDELSLRSMLNNLEQSNIISKTDIKTLNTLMYYRNKILHNTSKKIEYSAEEIKHLLDKAQEIIIKLSNIA